MTLDVSRLLWVAYGISGIKNDISLLGTEDSGNAETAPLT